MRAPAWFYVFIAICSVADAAPISAPAAIDVAVQRIRQDGATSFEIRASVFTHAAPERVWRLLTNYEQQPDYVPNLDAAHVRARSGNEVILEQAGRGGFFFFQRQIHLQVRVTERAPNNIEVALISGDMKRYSAHWQLTPAGQNAEDGTRIDYDSNLEPDFFVPPLIGSAIVKADVRRMLSAVVEQLEKNSL